MHGKGPVLTYIKYCFIYSIFDANDDDNDLEGIYRVQGLANQINVFLGC